MTEQTEFPAGAGCAVHRPLCPEGKAALDLPADGTCPARHRPFLLVATIIASAMALIDATAVTIALPRLQDDLGASFGAVQWVVNAYALFLGALILVGGAAGDRFGRRSVFLAGILLFTAASVACAIAPSVELLIAARSVQGLGAALLVPQSLAIIAAAYPRDERGRAIGVWAGASAIATALGPLLGGFLIDTLDWQAVFWINLPLSALVLYLTLRYVPESKSEANSGPVDWFGGLLAIAAFGALTVGLTLASLGEGTGVISLGALCAGVILLALFIRHEARAPNPLMPLWLFGDRVFLGANTMTLFLYGALTVVIFLLPFDLIERRGMSATQVGLTLLPVGIIIGVLSRFAGDIADRKGPRALLVIGSLLVAIGAVGLALGVENYWLGVFVPIVISSLGMALVVSPLTTAVMVSAPDDQSGVASGVNNAVSRVAGLFAVAIVGALASFVYVSEAAAGAVVLDTLRFGALPEAGQPEFAALERAFLAAYRAALLLAAVWALLSAAIAFALLGPSRKRQS